METMQDSSTPISSTPITSLPTRLERFWKLATEFGLGVLILVGAVVTIWNAKAFEEVMHFPPDWRPLARYLFPAVALATWGLTRAALLDAEGPRSRGKRKRLRNRGRWAIAIMIFWILLCLLYIALYSSWVRRVNSDSGHANEHDTVSREVIVLPLWPTAEFKHSLELRGGYEVVLDNDREWLDDALEREGGRILLTNLLLLVVGLVSVVAFFTGITISVSLPKRRVEPEEAAEHTAEMIAGGH